MSKLSKLLVKVFFTEIHLLIKNVNKRQNISLQVYFAHCSDTHVTSRRTFNRWSASLFYIELQMYYTCMNITLIRNKELQNKVSWTRFMWRHAVMLILNSVGEWIWISRLCAQRNWSVLIHIYQKWHEFFFH